MKLLTLTETKDSQQKLQTLKIMRSQEVEEVASKANAKLARAEADFNTMLARNRKSWELEEEDHSQRVREMSKEVSALEEKKVQALIPIGVYMKEADKVYKEAEKYLELAKERAEDSEELQSKLEEKLSEVSDREHIVKDLEVRLKIREQGIEIQSDHTKQGMEKLFHLMTETATENSKQEKSIDTRKREVALAEISFYSKLEKHKADVEALKVLELQLIDERETLKRAFARL